MISARAKSLPVSMYHYVNECAGAITVPPSLFEEHCRVLAEKGWRGVSLAEAEAYCLHGEALPEKTLLITFDDGYLDNYIYAAPVLHKYGHKGVFFTVSNRLEPEDMPRVSLEDVFAGRVPELPEVRMPIQKNSLGFAVRNDVFCNHAEARAMDIHGVMAVASHSRGHYGVCTGPEASGFWQPSQQSRTFYGTEEAFVWGMPQFLVRPGLSNRAFLPSLELTTAVRAFVPQVYEEAVAFFACPENTRALQALVAKFALRMGRYETDEEKRERKWREIAGGKVALEAVLGHAVQSLCWPWGAYDDEALSLARDAGFSLFFTTREGVNPPGRSLAVHRFKAKDKSGWWMLSRAWTYANPIIGLLYSKMRI